MRIIAFVNPMGGAGRTTLAVNLAACLAEMGKRVLLVDMDAQATATRALGLATEPGGNMRSALIDGTSPKDLVRCTRLPNLHVIRSHTELLEMEMSVLQHDQDLTRLQVIMAELRAPADFDYILLDCSPTMGVMTSTVMAAADELLVPVDWGYFTLAAVDCLLSHMRQVIDSGCNPGLYVGGVVINNFNGDAKQLSELVQQLRSCFAPRLSGSVIYNAVIPRNIALGEAPCHGLTILEYDNAGVAARAFRDLAREFVDRQNWECS